MNQYFKWFKIKNRSLLSSNDEIVFYFYLNYQALVSPLRRSVDRISYDELFWACELFEKDYYAYDDAWLQSYRVVDWNHLCDLSVDDVKTKVIGFLNKWKCRLPYSDSLAINLKEAHRDSILLLLTLEEETIEDWEEDEIKEVESRSLSNSKILLKVFSRFMCVGKRFSYVAASKVLHFLEPKLVVMWDNMIASRYHIPMSAENYVYRFIPLMKRMANEAIESYQTEKGCNREEAVLALYHFRPPKTIAKLLDEYNYMRFTRGESVGKTEDLSSRRINMGDHLFVRAVEGKDGRTISRAEDGCVILFDNTDPQSLLVKPGDVVRVRIVRVAETYLIARVVEPAKPPRPPRIETPNLRNLFNDFKELKNFVAGEGIIEFSVDSWMAERRKAKKYYQEMFEPEKLERMSAKDFATFLYYKNNRSWTTLYRMGLQLTSNMDELKRAIAHLQDESLELATRMRNVLKGGRLHSRGFGKNIASAILHICDKEDRYGVWNSRTEEGLERLNKKPPMPQDLGIAYVRINNSLVKLKNDLDIDLVMLDGFMWYISKKFE